MTFQIGRQQNRGESRSPSVNGDGARGEPFLGAGAGLPSCVGGGLGVCVCVSVCVCKCVWLCICSRVFVCLCICLSVHTSGRPSLIRQQKRLKMSLKGTTTATKGKGHARTDPSTATHFINSIKCTCIKRDISAASPTSRRGNGPTYL